MLGHSAMSGSPMSSSSSIILDLTGSKTLEWALSNRTVAWSLATRNTSWNISVRPTDWTL